MTAVLLAALVWKVIDFFRGLTNFSTQKSTVITQACAWVAGIIVIALAAHAQVAAGIVMPGFSQPLGDLDFGSVVLIGLVTASFGSTLVDVKQAIDNTDSASKPSLLPPSPPPIP